MKKIADNILSWCETPEEGALQQARNIAEHPCLIGNVCLMPDTHEGYGMPIGGVVALDNAVCPNMVGVDIGCGMLACETSITSLPTPEELKRIVAKIREKIPVGFSHHEEPQDSVYLDESWDRWRATTICKQEFENARKQLGTLGGGNHFIEIQRDETGRVWFMIHSGSRNVGKKVADHYNKLAEDLCKTWRQTRCVEHELAFLPRGTAAYEEYIREMELCIEFAETNRWAMYGLIVEAIREVLGEHILFQLPPLDIAHNYATLEHHYGRDVMVHRKGAILARKGTVGIIPGSQGTSSYIVRGLGNEASLCSCSHGAGRRMSRKKAREGLSLEDEIAKMDKLGIVHGITTTDDLDEAPSAYKDIDTVMSEQRDLVEIITQLTPIAVIKG